MNVTESIDEEADVRGLKCPEPLMVVRNRVRDMKRGETLHVCATDPSTQRDIPQYCRFLQHEMVRQWQDGDEFHYLLRKGGR